MISLLPVASICAAIFFSNGQAISIGNALNVNYASATTTQSSKFAIEGDWVYRSFHNDPDFDAEFNDLAFGKGHMTLNLNQHEVYGTLGGPGWNLDLAGYYAPDGEIRFQGTGIISGEQWIYDYSGTLVMPWPHGIDQRPAIVGSVIRTKEHSNGKSKAGYVGSFVAVRK